MHGLEARYSGRIQFVYLDIDDSRTQPFKAQLGYIYQPHIFLLDANGEILNQWVGLVTEAELENALIEAAP